MEDSEAVSTFVRWMADQRSSPLSTTSKYQGIVQGYLAHVAGKALSECTRTDVERFTQRARRGGGKPAASTVAVEVSVVGSFYRWAQTEFGWATNPATTAGRPKVNNRQPRPVDRDTWRQLWGCPRLDDEARVALGLAYFCGLRRQEIAHLRRSNVWGRQIVNFVRKGGDECKLDVGNLLDHWAYFAPDLLIDTDLLERPLRRLSQMEGDDYLLGWPNDPTAFNKRMAHWLVSAGLPSDRCTPHMLRHSCGTNLADSGAALDVIAAILGHRSMNTTMRYVGGADARLAAMRPDRPRRHLRGVTNG